MLGGAWWCLVELGGYWWWLMVLGGAWCCLALLGAAWCCLVVLGGGSWCVVVGQIQSKLKVTISLVFVAQSTSHACQIYLGFLFWVTMELYTPKMTKMASFFFNAQFNHRAHASGTLVV